MNPRFAAYHTLNEILLESKTTDNSLYRYASNFSSKQDLDFYYTLVKGSIKQKIHLEFILKHYLDIQKTDPKVMNLLILALFQITSLDSVPPYAAVNETIKISHKVCNKRISNFINAVLRSYLRQDKKIHYPHDDVDFISVKYSFPPYLIKKWLSIFSKKQTISLCEYFNNIPALALRVETDKISIDKFCNYLKNNKLAYRKSKYFNDALIIESSFNVADDEYFKKGLYYIQNESTLLPVLLLDPQKGEHILDMCAAPGGKSFYIASLTEDKAHITAVDNDNGRIGQFKENAKRMNHPSIDIVMKDVLYLKSNKLFEKIFIDAPCTGWGIMQRKSDIRLQSENRLLSLLPLQQKFLEKADTLLKKDGVLVYSTCTINPEENEKQIETFLKNHPNYSFEKPDKYIEKVFVTGNYIKTYPFKHKMDGSFASALRKAA
ncbi:MAG: 16S rRNA (cytosine(967)-C(5))-methyltransferase RsmB [Candidatus Cloacimonetes bacterium]|nr:16S rRNA (cytosine(967)-C(5))-methyltransferase RsmB [Candidatus Cloacimonadota bacterium]